MHAHLEKCFVRFIPYFRKRLKWSYDDEQDLLKEMDGNIS